MDHRESKKIYKYVQLSRELKENVEHKRDCDTNSSVGTWNGPPGLEKKKTAGIGNSKKQNHPDHSVVKIGLNTEKSHGDLKRFDVTQTPVKTHQLTRQWKTRTKWNNNDNHIFFKLEKNKMKFKKKGKSAKWW